MALSLDFLDPPSLTDRLEVPELVQNNFELPPIENVALYFVNSYFESLELLLGMLLNIQKLLKPLKWLMVLLP